MSETVIDVHNLVKRFGGFTAVDHISFAVQRGEVVGYLGPNGSGKTTTMRMLLGLLRPSGGSASVLGFDVVREAERIRVRVEDGTAVLEGRVRTWPEKQAILGAVSHAPGVRDVKDKLTVNPWD